MLRRFRALTEAGYPYLVAEDEGHVLGYAYAGAYRPRPAYRFSVENSIYIAANAHRRGVGRILLAALIDICTAKGYRQMIAVIGEFGTVCLDRAASLDSVSASREPSTRSATSTAAGSTRSSCNLPLGPRGYRASR